MSSLENELQDAMFEAASETLENMAFMEVIPRKERREELKYYSTLDILAPVTGTLTLVTTPKLAHEITAGLIDPEDGEPSEEMFFDALSELINTIGGRLMRVLTPEDETFSLGLPNSFSSSDHGFKKSSEFAHFEIDGQTFLVVATGDALIKYGAMTNSGG